MGMGVPQEAWRPSESARRVLTIDNGLLALTFRCAFPNREKLVAILESTPFPTEETLARVKSGQIGVIEVSAPYRKAGIGYVQIKVPGFDPDRTEVDGKGNRIISQGRREYDEFLRLTSGISEEQKQQSLAYMRANLL